MCAVLALVLAACAQQPMRNPAVQSCEQAFQRNDARLREAGLRDAGARRVPGFPYLRSNRFLASFRDQTLDGPGLDEWLTRMRALDLHERWIEMRNLHGDGVAADRVWTRLAVCGKRMLEADLAESERLALLRENVRVPDDYRMSARVLGAYPIAVPFLKAGIADWRESRRAVFDQPRQALPVRGRLQRYVPAERTRIDSEQVSEWLATARRDSALGIPELDAARLQALASRHAPIWNIDTMGRFDRIGAPGRNANGLFLDTEHRHVYVRPAYTRFGGDILLQLVYVAWFERRPAEGWLDPLAGKLDAIMWRVTLDTDGRVLLYDSAHSCGCYHQFFPSARLAQRADAGFWQEGIAVPAAAPAQGPLLLRIASGSHYLQSVGTASPPNDQASLDYDLVTYDALRLLRPQRLFNQSGLIPGSERFERWFLWPSGVRSPGAMRQWGRHATAFVGKRHFDEPFLIERYFQRRAPVPD